ncbi:hypothetical protein GCM10009087_49610 [Sphingomonas oligophenolica]
MLERTGPSRSGLYRRMEEGTFPKSIKISERCVAWRESEIVKWEKRKPPRRADTGTTL